MDLKTYINRCSKPERHELAAACNTTLGQLQNIAYGCRTCAPGLAVAIEKFTYGEVKRQELLPTDWQAIWPELATAANQAA